MAHKTCIIGFEPVPNNAIRDVLEQRFPLVPLHFQYLALERDDLYTTASLSDYDWMCYYYDTRFPTKMIGTLSIRFLYNGCTTCEMLVKQFIPAELSGYENYVVFHRYSFSADLFDRFMKRDLRGRINNITHEDTYYCNHELMLEWYNYVLRVGKKDENPRPIDEEFSWEMVFSKC